MLLAFHLFKLYGVRGNVHDKVDPRGVRGRVEIWGPHGGVHISWELAGRVAFKIFFDRVSCQKIFRTNVAVSAARTNHRAATFYLDAQGEALAVLRIPRFVSENVVLRLVFGDLFQTAQQIIGIDDDETAGTVRQFVERLLVRRSRLRDRKSVV